MSICCVVLQFPEVTFRQSVAESANLYCETNGCTGRKRSVCCCTCDVNLCDNAFSLLLRQNSRITADDVVIVTLEDSPDGGVIVTFYVKNSGDQQNIMSPDVLYEAVKVIIRHSPTQQ